MLTQELIQLASMIMRLKAEGQTIEVIGGYYLKCARHREKEFCLPSAKYAHIRVDNEYGFDAQKEWEKIEEMLTK